MELRQDLADTVKKAAAIQSRQSARPGTTGRSIYARLHQILIGPPRSGKTTQANAYVDALVAEGIIDKDARLFIEAHHLTDSSYVRLLEEKLQKLDRAVIVVDEIDKRRGAPDTLLEKLLTSFIEDKKGVVIMTGYEQTTHQYLQENTSLKMRMPAPLLLEPEPTPEEKAARKKESIIAEWRAIKTLTVHVEKPLKHPGKACFTKYKTPVS